jgi:hypothetical protein
MPYLKCCRRRQKARVRSSVKVTVFSGTKLSTGTEVHIYFVKQIISAPLS